MKFIYKESCRISEKEILKTAKKILPYSEHLRQVSKKQDYLDLEASIQCVADNKTITSVYALIKKKVTKKLKYIVVIGIGGSNLGTKALYDALCGSFDLLEPEKFPKIIFIDTNNTSSLNHLKKFFSTHIYNVEEILLCSISKSGGTTETIANAEIIIGFLRKHKHILDRVVVITGQESNLLDVAELLGIDTLIIPEKIGGRYSVFSAVGLFPLAAAGFDIRALLSGAKKIRTQCTMQDIAKNPAVISATILYMQYNKRRTIHNSFMFNSELESLGKWYRQLIGESIGKEKDINGKIVNIGITPLVSIGSTDLHSVGQLYLSNSKNIFTSFIYTEKQGPEVSIPKVRLFPNLIKMISGKTASDILNAILDGTKMAYNKKRIPFCEIILDSIDEQSIGEFFQFKMIEIMYLAKLLNINAFDQPNVEIYKKETKNILEKN